MEMVGTMKVAFLALLSVIVISANASESEKKKFINDYKDYLIKYYTEVTNKIKALKGKKNYTADEARKAAKAIIVEVARELSHVREKLFIMRKKLEKSGELKNFNVKNLVDPKLRERLINAIKDLKIPLHRRGSPRSAGAFGRESTSLATDIVSRLTSYY